MRQKRARRRARKRVAKRELAMERSRCDVLDDVLATVDPEPEDEHQDMAYAYGYTEEECEYLGMFDYPEDMWDSSEEMERVRRFHATMLRRFHE